MEGHRAVVLGSCRGRWGTIAVQPAGRGLGYGFRRRGARWLSSCTRAFSRFKADPESGLLGHRQMEPWRFASISIQIISQCQVVCDSCASAAKDKVESRRPEQHGGKLYAELDRTSGPLTPRAETSSQTAAAFTQARMPPPESGLSSRIKIDAVSRTLAASYRSPLRGGRQGRHHLERAGTHPFEEVHRVFEAVVCAGPRSPGRSGWTCSVTHTALGFEADRIAGDVAATAR